MRFIFVVHIMCLVYVGLLWSKKVGFFNIFFFVTVLMNKTLFLSLSLCLNIFDMQFINQFHSFNMIFKYYNN